jgi:pimeloyl-ACP methyl ester carboxylesterase
VLLVHGWGGNAAQMRAFVFPLLSAGYRVIAYDQPAHGVSEGRLTGLPDFADVLAEVAWHHGDVRAVIGHSLGATAAAMAHAWKKLDAKNIVLISPPSDMLGYSRRFARWHWMPEPLRRSMQAAIEERYGLRWEELELARVAPQRRARASRRSGAPTTISSRTPAWFATAVANSPSGPAPWITTRWWGSMRPTRSTAWTTVLSAQLAAEATPSGTPSGMRTRPEAGNT